MRERLKGGESKMQKARARRNIQVECYALAYARASAFLNISVQFRLLPKTVCRELRIHPRILAARELEHA